MFACPAGHARRAHPAASANLPTWSLALFLVLGVVFWCWRGSCAARVASGSRGRAAAIDVLADVSARDTRSAPCCCTSVSTQILVGVAPGQVSPCTCWPSPSTRAAPPATPARPVTFQALLLRSLGKMSRVRAPSAGASPHCCCAVRRRRRAAACPPSPCTPRPAVRQTYTLTLQVLALMTALTAAAGHPADDDRLHAHRHRAGHSAPGARRRADPAQPGAARPVAVPDLLRHDAGRQPHQRGSPCKPYSAGTIEASVALERAVVPLKKFMLDQTRESDIATFVRISGGKGYATPQDVPLTLLVPAFVTSELKTAFLIGFLIFIPFVIIDLVVASVLMSMGMMMLSPGADLAALQADAVRARRRLVARHGHAGLELLLLTRAVDTMTPKPS